MDNNENQNNFNNNNSNNYNADNGNNYGGYTPNQYVQQETYYQCVKQKQYLVKKIMQT